MTSLSYTISMATVLIGSQRTWKYSTENVINTNPSMEKCELERQFNAVRVSVNQEPCKAKVLRTVLKERCPVATRASTLIEGRGIISPLDSTQHLGVA